MAKAVIVDGYSHSGCTFASQRKLFSENGIDFAVENCRSEEEIIEKCKDADAILTVYGKITKNVIQALQHCKVIVRFGIGVDIIDIEAATAKGIPVCNIPDYCIEEVATHAMALILSLERKVMLYNNSVRKGMWDSHAGYPVHRLSTQVIGFIGFGNIAREAAKYAKAFGFEVVTYDPYLSEEICKEHNARKVELDELYREADVISVHVPLTKDTEHLINKDGIAKMKDGVIIINTSRGPLVCEKDLIEGIKSGKIKAAGIDVSESEPIHDPNHELYQYENLIVTPHAAFDSVESLAEMFEKVALTAIKVINGEMPYNVVNKKQLLKNH